MNKDSIFESPTQYYMNFPVSNIIQYIPISLTKTKDKTILLALLIIFKSKRKTYINFYDVLNDIYLQSFHKPKFCIVEKKKIAYSLDSF